MGEGRLDFRDGRALGAGNEAEHDGRLPDRFSKDLVVGGELLHLLPQVLQNVGLRPGFQGVGGREAIGLREHHVEANDGRTVGVQLLDQFSKQRARPGPLPEPFQGLLVDVDDADGKRRVEFARLHLLIRVEEKRPHSGHGSGVPHAQGEGGRNNGADNESVEKTRSHPAPRSALETRARSTREPSRWGGPAPVSTCHLGWGARFPQRLGGIEQIGRIH